MSKDASITNTPPYRMPMVRVDLVLLAVQQGRLYVMLSHREEAPFRGQWGLPGGVLRIDLDASLEAAAQRVANERLGRGLSNLAQVTTVGGPDRDPRAPWAMTVVFGSLVSSDLETTPGKRVQALKWRPISELDTGEPLAFDHSKLIHMAAQQLRQAVRDLRFPAGATPGDFTLPELQALSESILDEKLDKVTFRRRVEAACLVEPVAGSTRGGAHRPAQVYRFRSSLL